MSDLDSRCEKCERDIVQLWVEVGEVIKLVRGVLAGVDQVLAEIGTSNRQMFADLQAQTDAGFASLQARIDALPRTLSERKNDEPPKLN